MDGSASVGSKEYKIPIQSFLLLSLSVSGSLSLILCIYFPSLLHTGLAQRYYQGNSQLKNWLVYYVYSYHYLAIVYELKAKARTTKATLYLTPFSV